MICLMTPMRCWLYQGRAADEFQHAGLGRGPLVQTSSSPSLIPPLSRSLCLLAIACCTL